MTTILLIILFLIIPNIEFAIFTAAQYWVNIFTELSTMASESVSWSVTSRLDSINVYVKLAVFCCNVHQLYTYTSSLTSIFVLQKSVAGWLIPTKLKCQFQVPGHFFLFILRELLPIAEWSRSPET